MTTQTTTPAEAHLLARIAELTVQRAELLAAVKALVGDTPPVGKPGHIDFNQAYLMGKRAIRHAKETK